MKWLLLLALSCSAQNQPNQQQDQSPLSSRPSASQNIRLDNVDVLLKQLYKGRPTITGVPIFLNGFVTSATSTFNQNVVINSSLTVNSSFGVFAPGPTGPSLTNSNGILEVSAGGTYPDIETGVNTSNPFTIWIQGKKTNNNGLSNGITLQPLGGNFAFAEGGLAGGSQLLIGTGTANGAAVIAVNLPATGAAFWASHRSIVPSDELWSFGTGPTETTPDKTASSNTGAFYFALQPVLQAVGGNNTEHNAFYVSLHSTADGSPRAINTASGIEVSNFNFDANLTVSTVAAIWVNVAPTNGTVGNYGIFNQGSLLQNNLAQITNGIDSGNTRLLDLYPTVSTGGAYIFLHNDSAHRAIIGVDSSGGNSLLTSGGTNFALTIGTLDAYPLIFATNNTEYIRLSSSGLTSFAGPILVSGSSISLSGQNGNFVGLSSVTASGFFGDGSHLKGIPSSASISGVYVPFTGGTMTGGLQLNNASMTLTGANAQIVNVGTATIQGNAFSVGGSTLNINNGNVGIGTSTPAAPLHIKSSLQNGASGQLLVDGPNATRISMNDNEPGGVIWSIDNDINGAYLSLHDVTHSRDNLNILSSNGNIGTSGVTAPGFKLDTGTYEIITNACTSVTSCTATCSAGKQVTGGGCTGTTSTFADSAPGSASTWVCTITLGNVTAKAICMNID